MKDAYYFSHDSNASQDPKILQMCSVYKAEGYGWYWMLIEMMREQENYKIPIKGKYVFNSLAIRSYTNVDTFVQFINDCVLEFKLFRRDENNLWSESLLKRMKFKEEKSTKAKKAVESRWAKKQGKSTPQQGDIYRDNTDVSNSHTDVSNIDTLKESKVKEIKRKEMKLKYSKLKKKYVVVTVNKPKVIKKTFGQMIDIFSGNIHLITGIESQKLQDWSKDIEPDAIILAIEEAVKRNARNLGYIEAILRSWIDKGYKTKSDVENASKEWAEKNKQESKNNGKVDTFNNYDQRTYDYNDLEKNLLNGKEEINESVDSKKLIEELKNKAKNKEG